jgi:hypothetical protein
VKSVGTQIEDMFQSGWPGFLSRTRLKRWKDPHVTRKEGAGDKGSDEDEEVFDDTDFYQQLLRDVIESKGGGSGQLMENQRRKKSKKNVDTRASKGRKLRFVIFTMSVDHCLTGIQQIRGARKDTKFHGASSSPCGGVARSANRRIVCVVAWEGIYDVVVRFCS